MRDQLKQGMDIGGGRWDRVAQDKKELE